MPRRLTDNDPRRELRRQLLLLDKLEGRFSGRVASEIDRAMQETLRVFEATGEVMPPRDHHERMKILYRQMYEGAFQTFGMRIVDQGKSMGIALERKESFLDMFVRAALEFVQQELIRQRIVLVTETTRAQIARQVQQGFDDGLSVAETARRIADNVEPISRQRAAVIARTELHGAANAGADTAARATGLQLRKEWVPVADPRTRGFAPTNGRVDKFDHRQMRGQVVGMDEPFLMPQLGGDPVPCMYPGDPSLPAAAVINCRCAVSHQVVGFDE